LAACSAAPAASASPDEPDASSPVAQATASASPSSPESSEPSIAPDTDLAELLPTTLAGTEFTVSSLSGEQVGTVSFGRLGGIATNLGMSASDVDAAVAVGPDWDPNLGPEVFAIRYGGADSAAIVDEVAPAFGGAGYAAGTVEVTDESIAGKSVSVMEVPLMSGGASTFYFYAIGDVAFIVHTPGPAVAEDALSQPP
jgi:hypothetical protein